jgi:hypothetical protein
MADVIFEKIFNSIPITLGLPWELKSSPVTVISQKKPM